MSVRDAAPDQPRASAILDRALAQDRVAHAYAFIGAPGSGRTATARAFAARLLCERGGCGACRACRMTERGQHPDLHVVLPTPPDGNPRGKKMVRIAAIRELERQASLRPVMAPRKVFIVTAVDDMTEDAPEAFLKTLEEPPAHTVLILILERARSVPATVLSRCQIVRFAPPPAPVPPERATALALLAEVRDKGLPAAFARFDRSRPDRAEAEAIVDAWWLWCRDLLLVKAGVSARLLSAPDRADDLAREAASWSLDDIVAAIARCREAREALAVNVAPRLTLETLLMTLVPRMT
ncbi:MAG: DNA polymerase III subunit [Candidatus Rokubacteria bacterium]|nr:DNA polymerase III subunit [Candidatus Rokubacteria bacterium]